MACAMSFMIVPHRPASNLKSVGDMSRASLAVQSLKVVSRLVANSRVDEGGKKGISLA
jgi:hypothetical protein